MANSAGAVQNGLVLRLSLPASGELVAVGSEMATKLAEQLGVPREAAEQVGASMTELARQVAAPGNAEVSFEFHKADTELKIEARHESRVSTTRVQLTA